MIIFSGKYFTEEKRDLTIPQIIIMIEYDFTGKNRSVSRGSKN